MKSGAGGVLALLELFGVSEKSTEGEIDSILQSASPDLKTEQ